MPIRRLITCLAEFGWLRPPRAAGANDRRSLVGRRQPRPTAVAWRLGPNDGAPDQRPDREVKLRREREAVPAAADDPALVDEEGGRGSRDPVGPLDRTVRVTDHRD